MLKKAVLWVVFLWLILLTLFYVSCKKENKLQWKSKEKEEVWEEKQIQITIKSQEDCQKYSQEDILSQFLAEFGSEIPYSLNNQNQVEILYLNGVLTRKKINQVPLELICFEALKELGLNNQGITSLIGAVLFELENLKILDLSNNKINEIDFKDFKKLKNLKILYLDGKKFK